MEVIECVLTSDQRAGLLSRFTEGYAALITRPLMPDEVGQPLVTRREWNRDDPDYRERGERVAAALASLSMPPNSPEQQTYTLRGDRAAIQYIGTCISISLIMDGVSSRAIFAGDTEAHADVGIYSQLMTAVENRPVTQGISA